MRLTLALLFLASTWSYAEGLSVGFAEKDVTPKLGGKPVYLAGFGHNRIAKKIHDPIMARTIVLSDGKQLIAFTSVDVVGLFNDFARKIHERLPKFQYICVSSTHNHEGPDTLGLWGKTPFASGVDPDYMKLLEDGVVESIEKAQATLQEAKASIGSIPLPELITDNRQPLVKMEPLVAIRFENRQGKPIGIWVQWHNHPETMDDKNTEITADFVHYTVTEIARNQGCPVAYFTGVVGGLMTTLRVPLRDEKGNELKDGTWEKTELLGKRVAEGAIKALKNTEPLDLTPFALQTKSILIPVANELYKLGWRAGVLKRTFYTWDGDPYSTKAVEMKDLSKPGSVRTEVSLHRLGQLEIAVIPGEIYPELVLGKIQDPVDPGADFPDAPIEPSLMSSMKAKHRMFIGLGNDEIGYIIPKRQWDSKPPYCYGLKKEQYGEVNSVGPEAAPIICRAFAELSRGKK